MQHRILSLVNIAINNSLCRIYFPLAIIVKMFSAGAVTIYTITSIVQARAAGTFLFAAFRYTLLQFLKGRHWIKPSS